MIRHRVKTRRLKKMFPQETILKKRSETRDFFDATSPLILAAEAVLKS
jgi:hypothetical protein